MTEQSTDKLAIELSKSEASKRFVRGFSHWEVYTIAFQDGYNKALELVEKLANERAKENETNQANQKT